MSKGIDSPESFVNEKEIVSALGRGALDFETPQLLKKSKLIVRRQ